MIVSFGALIVFLVLTYGVAAIGGFFGPDAWYASLPKPTWTPPPWLFGPVWSILYTLMAIAAWLVWRQTGVKHPAIALYAAQLVFNALWSPLFFGLHRPDFAFVDLVVLLGTIVATCVMFWRVNVAAGVLFLPYIAWVSFAGVLNFTIMQMWLAQRG